MRESCLITGYGGFIGSHLAWYLVNQGMRVYGTVNRPSTSPHPPVDKIETFECDMTDGGKVRQLISELNQRRQRRNHG